AATSWDSVITLAFDEQVTAASTNAVSHYTVFQTGNAGATLTVRSATRQADGSHVKLLVSPMSHATYTVIASGIQDLSCFGNVANQTSAQFQGPPVAVEPEPTSATLELAPPLPNPTPGRALFEYAVPAGGGRVTLDVYDLGGR